MRARVPRDIWIIAAGDILAIGIVTMAGFARHGEILSSGLRPLTTFVPYSLAWFLIAPFLGAYQPKRTAELRELWRPGLAALAAAPFAAMLRSLILNTPLQPIFVLVLGLTGAFGIMVWRLLFYAMQRRVRTDDG